ncbi:MAG: FAD-dependent thymidylate synthase [Candidatus Aminicenantes bacterium]|nr:FAD-dependent thymidylate synthase [Candidatus Aminicenantes bacterium]
MINVELLSITPSAEKLIENAGRTAYLSFHKEIKTSGKDFLKMLINKDHISVLEHAQATFRVKGGSRSFTHQMVRHRLCSFTQQSQRYVDESRFGYIVPDSIKKNSQAQNLFRSFMSRAKKVYGELQEMGIKNEDARFILPNAVESEIVITANFREWRHIFELRGGTEAQWEIRTIIIKILKILKKKAPAIFEDFIIDEEQQVIKKIETN